MASLTYKEWMEQTVERLVEAATGGSPEAVEAYLALQIPLALNAALRHGRAGRGPDDPIFDIPRAKDRP